MLPQRPKFKTGERVRIPMKIDTFNRGYRIQVNELLNFTDTYKKQFNICCQILERRSQSRYIPRAWTGQVCLYHIKNSHLTTHEITLFWSTASRYFSRKENDILFKAWSVVEVIRWRRNWSPMYPLEQFAQTSCRILEHSYPDLRLRGPTGGLAGKSLSGNGS